MILPHIKRSGLLLLLVLSPLLLGSCSDQGVGPKAGLAPLVGLWSADAIVLTNEANPSMVVDLIEEGADFTLSILGNGTYQAVMKAFGQPSGPPQSGKISVSGNELTLTPTGSYAGAATSGTWAIEGGTLIIEGETEFDFNMDGTREAAQAHMEFHKLES